MLKLQSFFNKTLPVWVINILCIICCLFIFPFSMHTQPQGGLDPSWAIAINLGIKNGFIWGKDFLFSYGPLGYLSTGISVYTSKIFVTTFYLAIWLNSSLIFYKVISGLNNPKPISLFIAFLFAIALRYFLVFDLSTALMFNCIFWLLYSIKNDNFLGAVVAVAISLFMFFIKIDTGFVINIFILIFYWFQFTESKNKLLFGVLSIANYALLFLLCIPLRVDFWGYVTAGIHTINAYNDAMYLPNDTTTLLMGLSVVICFFASILTNIKQIFSEKRNIVVTLFLLLAMFVLFKHAFVRHSGDTFIEPPYPLIATIFFYYFIKPNNLYFVKPLLILPLFFSISIKINHHIDAITPSQPLLYNIKTKSENFVYKHLLHQKYTSQIDTVSLVENPLLRPYFLPNRIVNKVGKSTVDIIPILVSTIYFDSLHYNPRPGIQSYANYDTYLDKAGADKYLSQTAPDYIIYCAEDSFRNATIDNRYPFFDEPITKLALLQTYEIVDSFDNQILLKHADKRKKIIYGAETISHTQMNTPITIPSTNALQMMKVNISYNFLGKLMRFFYQPPEINAIFTLKDGNKHKFRVIKTVLEEGVIANGFIVKNKDFANLFRCDSNNIPQISSIQFVGSNWGFDNDVVLKWQQIDIR